MRPRVDSGVDLVAQRPEKSEIYYKFQVKTTSNAKANFKLTEEQFANLYKSGINLIVVSLATTEPEALILPPSLVYMMTSGGSSSPEAPLRIQHQNVRFYVIFRAGRIFVRNLKNEFTFMKDRFDLLEDTEIDPYHIPNYAGWSDNPAQLIEFFDD